MEKKFIKIEDILKQPSLYYAHEKTEGEDRKVWETLEAHTLLCQKYFAYIDEKKYIGKKVSHYLEIYMEDSSLEAKELAMDMWRNVVTFHDVGKHNPNFQRNILGRKNIPQNESYLSAGSRHSALSALMYLDYYYKKMRSMKKSDVQYLCALALSNAHAVSRHHSGLSTLEDFKKSLEERGENGRLLKALQEKKELDKVSTEEFQLEECIIKNMIEMEKEVSEKQSRKQAIWRYFYQKLTYSMLVASDYYATSEFESGVEIKELGEIDDILEIFQIYQKTNVNQAIRKYETEYYPLNLEDLKKETNINVLRNEIFLDAEKELQTEKEKNIFYLEAPTGSGKSNISMNLSFQLAREDKQLKKIYYIYPFNTLVEQNQENLKEVFGDYPNVITQIAVINSITPIKYVQKGRENDAEKEKEDYYEKALLNRQFLNYPMILTTHVSLFDTIFGDSKESAFGFHQLSGSILVLDEIQSYKNSIWEEIISFLSELAEYMHMKVIIMSATLPNLEMLTGQSENTVYLIKNREKYFCHPCFQKRVCICKELLEQNMEMEDLYQHVKKNVGDGKKILIEFITKIHAEEFYHKLKEAEADEEIEATVLCMSGDDSILERKRTIEQIKGKGKSIILVATQVVEAGLDIDMDIGYKNISKMDSEEQFLGRINRSCTYGKTGMVYFFELDRPQKVYKNDMRLSFNFMIKKPNIWKMLEEKDFHSYYELILNAMIDNQNGIEKFFQKEVGELNFPAVCRHMKLIDKQNWNMSVFLGRKIQDENGDILDGKILWEQYKNLLQDMEIGYAEKRVRLSAIKAKMNYFIYEIRQNSQIIYNDQIGELFYIEDGEKYFENGRLNRKMIQGQLGDFVDFI